MYFIMALMCLHYFICTCFLSVYVHICTLCICVGWSLFYYFRFFFVILCPVNNVNTPHWCILSLVDYYVKIDENHESNAM